MVCVYGAEEIERERDGGGALFFYESIQREAEAKTWKWDFLSFLGGWKRKEAVRARAGSIFKPVFWHSLTPSCNRSTLVVWTVVLTQGGPSSH